MGLERGAFGFGFAKYPLERSTATSLLETADPAIHHTLGLLAFTFHNYFGARLLAQANQHGLYLPNAVVQTAHFDPAPYLLSDQFRFPLLCLYRKKDVWDEHTIVYDKASSTWEFAYVLPTLQPVQVRELHPVLRAASVTIRRVLHMGWDPGYLDGENIWALAGIQKARLLDVTYGGYGRVDNIDEFYRAITGTISVLEREQPRPDEHDDFNGVDAAVDIRDTDETTVADVALVQTHEAPTITAISPATGTSAGGTAVTITGTGFHIGTRPRVLFGGAQADAVVVVSATSITCLTPPHAAYPSEAVDVAVINADGQSTEEPLEDAFTFTA